MRQLLREFLVDDPVVTIGGFATAMFLGAPIWATGSSGLFAVVALGGASFVWVLVDRAKKNEERLTSRLGERGPERRPASRAPE